MNDDDTGEKMRIRSNNDERKTIIICRSHHSL